MAIGAVPFRDLRFLGRQLEESLRITGELQTLTPSQVVRRQVPLPARDLVTVIIPMRNATRWIDMCLISVLGQTHWNLEVFCVDDASEDDTYTRVVDRFSADRRLCAIQLGHRVGPYQIKNWIVHRLARGSFVAMQDADDASHPTRIEAQLDWMRRKNWRVSGTWAHQFFPEDILPRFGTAPRAEAGGYLHNIAVYKTVRQTRAPIDFAAMMGPRRDYVAMHATQVFERQVLLEFGGFDGRTLIGADTELNWRLLRFTAAGNVPRVLYTRRLHPASLTRDAATCHGSPRRQMYVAERDRRHLEIANALAAGNLARVRDLCTEDLYHADIDIREMHSGFDIALKA